jgi:hypothetical protein
MLKGSKEAAERKGQAIRKQNMDCSLFKSNEHIKVFKQPKVNSYWITHLSQASSICNIPSGLVVALLVTLELLSCRSTCSLGCDLPQIHTLCNRMALILLEQIRRIYPFSWMKDRKDIVLPREEFDGKEVQKAQAISLLLEMTQQIYSLFSTKESSGA